MNGFDPKLPDEPEWQELPEFEGMPRPPANEPAEAEAGDPPGNPPENYTVTPGEDFVTDSKTGQTFPIGNLPADEQQAIKELLQDAKYDSLRTEIMDQVRQMIDSEAHAVREELHNELRNVQQSMPAAPCFDDYFKDIFPAKLTPGSGTATFDEWTFAFGEWVKFTDGRHVTSDGTGVSLRPIDPDIVWVKTTLDLDDDGKRIMRYVVMSNGVPTKFISQDASSATPIGDTVFSRPYSGPEDGSQDVYVRTNLPTPAGETFWAVKVADDAGVGGLVWLQIPSGNTYGVYTLGLNELGSEEPDESADWDLGVSRSALDLWIETRARYYDEGDAKWYSYARRLSFTSGGNLYHCDGTETRIEVTEPDDC